ATEAVVRAPPDGYTLLLANGANAISATLYEKLSFDFIRDIAPVASIGEAPIVMVTNPSFPAKTVPEFIAYAKANPGKINMATGGVGATPYLAGELFKGMTGVEWVWVQYRSEYMPDLISGQGGTPHCFPRSANRIGHLVRSASRRLASGSHWEARQRVFRGRPLPH